MVAKMTDIRDRQINIGVNGSMCIFDLSGCTEEELKNFKRLLMCTLQDLPRQRGLLYEAIAKINGELDRRVNESTPCTPSTPCAPASGGQL